MISAMRTKSSLRAGSRGFRFLGFAFFNACYNAISRAFAAEVSAIFLSKAFPNFRNKSRMMSLSKIEFISHNSFIAIIKFRKVFGIFMKVDVG
jgi:hypothetical protein